MKQFTLQQRYALKAYLDCGKPKQEIATLFGFHKSSIYREINRNKTKQGSYNPDFANELAGERKERLCLHRKFGYSKQKLITHWIKEEQWLPEQIKGYCEKNSIKRSTKIVN